MAHQFSPAARDAILRAQNLATEQGSGIVSEAHLFLAVLDCESETVSALLTLSGVSREEARLYAESAVEIFAVPAGTEARLSLCALKALHSAAIHAENTGVLCAPHHILIACLSHGREARLGEVLGPLGLDAASLRAHLRGMKSHQTAQQSAQKLTARAEKALEAAQAEMRASFCGRIAAAHLLLGLLSDKENIAVEMLQKVGCDLEDLQKRARDSIKNDGEIATPQKRFSPGAKRALERAARATKSAGHKYIDCGDLLLGLLPGRETLGEKWRARGRKLDGVEELWTAEQVEALRLPVKTASVEPIEVATPSQQKRFAAPQILYFVSLFLGLCWGALLSTPAPSKGSLIQMTVVLIGLGVLLVSGLGTCLTMMLDRSPRAKQIWLNVFGGWILGAIIAAILSTHL